MLILAAYPGCYKNIFKIYIIADVSYKNSIKELVRNTYVRNFRRDEGDVAIEEIETLS